jgi:hypothetical protein
VFLPGTAPVLVEGKHDRALVQAAWRGMFGEPPENAGVHVLQSGGDGQMEAWWELLDRLYPVETTFYVLLDAPKTPSAHKGMKTIADRQDSRVTRLFVLDVGDITLDVPRDEGVRRSTDIDDKDRDAQVLCEMASHGPHRVHPEVVRMLQAIARNLDRREVPSVAPSLPDRQAVAVRLSLDPREVLTVEEAAAHLEVPADEVVRRIARSSVSRPPKDSLFAWRHGWQWWLTRDDLTAGG